MSIRLSVVALLLAASVPVVTVEPATSFPSRLDSYFRHTIKLSDHDRRQLASGQPVIKLLPSDATKEVAMFGATWINAPVRRYVDAVNDIENFEKSKAFALTRRISAPPRIEDFADLQLPHGDVDGLKKCRVGHCDLKLCEQAVNRFRTEVNWNAPEADAQATRLMRQVALGYANRYLERGNDGLAVYRDTGHPTSVAQEFRGVVEATPELTSLMPDVRDYLLGYPKVGLPNATSFLYWQEMRFGLKPTFRISHVTVGEEGNETLVVSKMLYASHYFWTGLELRRLIPDPSRGPGFWLVTVNRSRSDGLSGLLGVFVRPRVRSDAQKATLATLRGTKQLLETGSR